MHDDRILVEERITRELTERLPPLVHPQRRSMGVEAGPSIDELAPFAVGERWGPPWGTTWFRFTGDVPAPWTGQRVEALLDLGFRIDAPGFQCEGLVRDDFGRPVQGVHPQRQAVAVTAAAGPVALVVEAASNPAFPQFRPSPMGLLDTAGDRLLYRLDRAELVLVDAAAEALLHDADVLDGVMRALAVTDPRRHRIRRALEEALDTVARSGSVADARAQLAPELAIRSSEAAHRVIATGHAHLDTAWLWPMGETVRKCTRTFASMVALMDDYPDLRFSCSQAQHYDWMAEHEPELLGRITAKVAAGQWIPVGGMWVEPDMNLPSGESIVRQIVHGQRWFESHFGRRCTEVWIPDVFGYPAGLPQVFAAGGLRRFVTQKLSWNRTNRFPHSTFWWEGVDGTRVLTHFPPVDTYNAELTPAELGASVERFAEHAWSRWSLAPFGYGDGGGGPTREMLERQRRLADLDGMPRVKLGTAEQFFDHVDAEVRAGAPVPVWRGELYFETHRGTLTSQLRTKAGNRRCERLLREAELWVATADTSSENAARLDQLWREVLTQQFHDILPGSSIAWVHADAEAAHTRIGDELEEIVGGALATLAPDVPTLASAATHPRDEVVITSTAPIGDGAMQPLPDGRHAFRARLPGLGLAPAVALAVDDRVVTTDRSMTNGQLAVGWGPDGHLSSVIDLARARQLLVPGEPGAVLELSPDRPVRYDAWDLESWARRDPARLVDVESVDVIAGGPLVGMVRVRRRFGPSAATLTYVLRAGSPRLDVVIEVDWHHVEHLLSLAFPIDVRADEATCGVQFGAVRRPTHASTSWDAAKFEVCAHRYVDVSEPSFGVAVLDDGRYGHAVLDGVVRVSLVRAARYPDPQPDQGRHEVTISLYPHGPGLADVVAEAERLNLPIREVAGGRGTDGARRPIVDVRGRGVEVDAVKAADDGRGDLIVRFHEACGDRTPVTVGADRRIVAAWRCDLLEDPQAAVDVSDGIVTLTLRPFELVTLRLTRS